MVRQSVLSACLFTALLARAIAGGSELSRGHHAAPETRLASHAPYDTRPAGRQAVAGDIVATAGTNILVSKPATEKCGPTLTCKAPKTCVHNTVSKGGSTETVFRCSNQHHELVSPRPRKPVQTKACGPVLRCRIKDTCTMQSPRCMANATCPGPTYKCSPPENGMAMVQATGASKRMLCGDCGVIKHGKCVRDPEQAMTCGSGQQCIATKGGTQYICGTLCGPALTCRKNELCRAALPMCIQGSPCPATFYECSAANGSPPDDSGTPCGPTLMCGKKETCVVRTPMCIRAPCMGPMYECAGEQPEKPRCGECGVVTDGKCAPHAARAATCGAGKQCMANKEGTKCDCTRRGMGTACGVGLRCKETEVCIVRSPPQCAAGTPCPGVTHVCSAGPDARAEMGAPDGAMADAPAP
jgi:hypothetical protein